MPSFTKSSVFKIFSVQTNTKSQRFEIALVWRAFSKRSVTSSWRISVDGSPKRRNKAPFSNFSSVLWMRPHLNVESNLHLLLFSITVLTFVIGLKISRHFHGQWKNNPNHSRLAHTRSPARGVSYTYLGRVCLIHWIVFCAWPVITLVLNWKPLQARRLPQ